VAKVKRASRATRRVAAPAQPAAAPATNGRTEEDKVFQGPVTVVLGGKSHEVRPLTIRESREWRKLIAAPITAFSQNSSVSSDNAEAFRSAMVTMIVTTPDELADMFFGYAQDLNREEIEVVATDAELAVAIDVILEVAFPLLRNLGGVASRLMNVL